MIRKPGVTIIFLIFFFLQENLKEIVLMFFVTTVISISLCTQYNSQTCILLVCTRNITVLQNSVY